MKLQSRWIAALSLAIVLAHSSTSRGGELYVISSGGNVGTIDTSSLAYTSVGSLGPAAPAEWWGGIAYDANANVLYGVERYSSNDLYTIDMGNGNATAVGSHGTQPLSGIAYDSKNGVLYTSQLTGTKLLTLDVSLAPPSVSTDDEFDSSQFIGALAYDTKRDQLVGWYEFEDDYFAIDIDPITGQATLTQLYGDGSATHGSNIGDLTYDLDLDLFWGVDWNGSLFSLDPNDPFTPYKPTNLLDLVSLVGAFPAGIAYIYSLPNDPNSPSPLHSPEPTSLAAFGVAALALGLARARRRRRPPSETACG
ncbi:MAG: PEP-CTERM sorting domain-containing protein [Planctomycetaceae bacterium]